jgi:hypothetical protein
MGPMARRLVARRRAASVVRAVTGRAAMARRGGRRLG